MTWGRFTAVSNMLMLRSDSSELVGVTDPTSSVVADGVLAVGRRASSAHWEHRKLLKRGAKQPLGGGGRGSCTRVKLIFWACQWDQSSAP